MTVWRGRVAPVFDVAGNCLLGESEGFGHPVAWDRQIAIPAGTVGDVVSLMVALGAQALVCGAISREGEAMVLSEGLELFAFVSGSIDEISDAWRSGSLQEERYSMPGCACPRHRRGMGGHGYGGRRRQRQIW